MNLNTLFLASKGVKLIIELTWTSIFCTLNGLGLVHILEIELIWHVGFEHNKMLQHRTYFDLSLKALLFLSVHFIASTVLYKMSEEEKDEIFVFLWFKITNESIPLIKWDGLKSILIIGILSLIIVLNVWFKGLIINYIVRFAPKDRPINEMMLLEQVSLFTFKAAVCLQNTIII